MLQQSVGNTQEVLDSLRADTRHVDDHGVLHGVRYGGDEEPEERAGAGHHQPVGWEGLLAVLYQQITEELFREYLSQVHQ